MTLNINARRRTVDLGENISRSKNDIKIIIDFCTFFLKLSQIGRIKFWLLLSSKLYNTEMFHNLYDVSNVVNRKASFSNRHS